MRLTDSELEQAWASYCGHQDQVSLERIVEHYSPLADFLARQAIRRAPAHQDSDDIYSYAHRGLLQAAQRFRPERGVKFESFANLRITGAIKDAQRKDDPLTRNARTKVNALREAQRKIWEEQSRAPTLIELATELGVEVVEVRALIIQQQTLTQSLDSKVESGAIGEVGVADGLHVSEVENQAREALAIRLAELGDRDLIFVLLFYVDQKTLRAVGEAFGCSDSRCAQIRKDVMGSLLAP